MSADKQIAAQDLLKRKPDCYGWMRRISVMQEIGSKIEEKLKINRSKSLSARLPWQQRYIILSKGKLYIYKDETSPRAQKVLVLSDFERFLQVEKEDNIGEVTWPFQLVRPADSKAKNEYFSVTSEEELTKWEKKLSKEMSQSHEELSKWEKKPSKGMPQKTEASSSDEDEYTVPDDCDDLAPDQRPLPPTPNDARKTQARTSSSDHASPPPRPSPQQRPGKVVPCRTAPPLPDSDEEIQHHKQPSYVDIPKPGAKPPLMVRTSEGRPVPKPPTVDGGCSTLPLPRPRPKPPQEQHRPSSGSSKFNNNNNNNRDNKHPNQGRASVGDDLIYEDTSKVDSAMWTGTAEAAQNLMKQRGLPDGFYLVRKSTDGTGYTLLAICNGLPCKFKIQEDPVNRSVKLATTTCDSLEMLLLHFSETNLPNKTTPLTLPHSQR